MRAALGVILASFVFASGCAPAQQDWIDRTLTMVDVTGVWDGLLTYGRVEVDLKQEGAKVTGVLKGIRNFDGNLEPPIPIVGTVNGDALSFHEASGYRGMPLLVEVRVNGDEMTGSGRRQLSWAITLRRRPPQ